MVISSKTLDVTPSLKIGTCEIGTVKIYESLGMLLDSMSHQIDSMDKKANMRLGILCKIRSFVYKKNSVRIYKTMICPHMKYIDFIVESSTKEKI